MKSFENQCVFSYISPCHIPLTPPNKLSLFMLENQNLKVLMVLIPYLSYRLNS